MEPIIAEDVTRRHTSGRGVHDVSLSVRAGRCLAVLGANGSGKTTLTRLVAGLERAQMSVLGDPGHPRPRHLRRRCGVALDTPAHWDNLSGRQNLWFFARQYGLGGSLLPRRVDELLSGADLTAPADEPVANYSFGMRRKLSIIEALCHDPDLLILDEPSAGVDAAFLDRLVRWIRRRCKDGETTWVADRDADWLSRAATDAIMLCDGRVKAAGDVEELMASVDARNRIDILLEEDDFTATPNISGVESFRYEEKHVSAQVQDNPEKPLELLRWITSCGGHVRSMEVRSVTLYDALMRRAAPRETRP
jgi:ABC-type multidrug transport system ATPase subunit